MTPQLMCSTHAVLSPVVSWVPAAMLPVVIVTHSLPSETINKQQHPRMEGRGWGGGGGCLSVHDTYYGVAADGDCVCVCLVLCAVVSLWSSPVPAPVPVDSIPTDV